MTKVAYNRNYGGFCLSEEVVDYIISNSHWDEDDCDFGKIPRHDPILIKALELFPDEEIGIAEIDSDRYWIWEYDGIEKVYTPESIPWVIINKE